MMTLPAVLVAARRMLWLDVEGFIINAEGVEAGCQKFVVDVR
jgi:hypothetical protein